MILSEISGIITNLLSSYFNIEFMNFRAICDSLKYTRVKKCHFDIILVSAQNKSTCHIIRIPTPNILPLIFPARSF